jgi:hypothetical protein
MGGEAQRYVCAAAAGKGMGGLGAHGHELGLSNGEAYICGVGWRCGLGRWPLWADFCGLRRVTGAPAGEK